MLVNLFKSFWRPRFVRIFLSFYLIGLFFFCLLSLYCSFAGSKGGLLCELSKSAPGEDIVKAGDFPVFYAAGSLSIHDSGHLYDVLFQEYLQNYYWRSENFKKHSPYPSPGQLSDSAYDLSMSYGGDEDTGFHIFAYPPWAAVFFIPFALFSPLVAKVLFVLLSLLFSYLSANFIRSYVAFPISPFVCFSLLLFIPTYVSGVLGGQNNAVSLFLLLAILSSVKNRKYYISGAFTALWNFKPQYSFLAILMLLYFERERIKILSAYLFVTLIQLGFSIWYYGVDIFISWINMMRTLGELNQSSHDNLSRMISIPSLGQYLYVHCGLWGLSILVLLVLMLIFRPIFQVQKHGSFDLSIIGLLIVFFSPQTGHYDLVLAVPFLVTFLRDTSLSPFFWKVLGFVFLIAASLFVQFTSGVPVLTMVLFLTGAVVLSAVKERA